MSDVHFTLNFEPDPEPSLGFQVGNGTTEDDIEATGDGGVTMEVGGIPKDILCCSFRVIRFIQEEMVTPGTTHNRKTA